MSRITKLKSFSLKTLFVIFVFLKMSYMEDCKPCAVNQSGNSASTTKIIVMAGCKLVNSNFTSTVTDSSLTVYGLMPGNTYTFQLNCSATLCWQVFTTNPDVIRNLTVTQTTMSSVSLTWSDPEGIHSFYVVQWNVSGITNNKTTNGTFANITALTPGTQYTFEVLAIAADNKTEGAPVSTTQYTRPDVIRNLTVTQITTSSVSLTWSDPQGSHSFYRVQWDVGTIDVQAVFCNVGNLTAGTQYTFTVTAFAADNKMQGSAVSKAQFTRPDVVSNLSVTAFTESSVSLSWSPPGLSTGNATVYRVDWKDSNVLKNKSTASTSINITDLTAGTPYTFRIFAVISDNLESAPVNLTQFTKPGKPQNISAVNQGNDSLSVFWSPPLGTVSMYEVTIKNPQLNFTKSYTIPTNYTTLPGLRAGMMYQLTVASISGSLKNSSDTVQIATRPNPPGALEVVGKTNISISLSWDGGVVYANYSIAYTSSLSDITQTILSAQSQIQLSGLMSGTMYSLSVETVGFQGLRSTKVLRTEYTLPNPVQNLEASPSANSVTLQWDSPAGMQSYYTYRVDISSSAGLVGSQITTGNKVNITNLEPGTKFNCSVTTLALNDTYGSSAFTFCWTKPKPVGNLSAVAVDTTTMSLKWTSPDYEGNTYYVIYMQPITMNVTNKSVDIPELSPGTSYAFAVTAVVNMLESDPVNTSVFTKPDSMKNITVFGTTTTLTVIWDRPAGNVMSYRVDIYNGTSLTANQTVVNNSAVFSGLKPGRIYNVCLTTLSGSHQVEPEMVNAATYPNPPSFIKLEDSTTDSMNISWGSPQDMDSSQYKYIIYHQGNEIVSSENWIWLGNLTSETVYNVSVATVGPMNYTSTRVTMQGYTRVGSVIQVEASEITTSTVSLVWIPPASGRSYEYLITVSHLNQIQATQFCVNGTDANIGHLQSGSSYTFSVIVKRSGFSDSSAKSITLFTKPYPIGDLESKAINETVVYLNWTRPQEYQAGYTYWIQIYGCMSATKNQSALTEEAYIYDLVPGTKCSIQIYSKAVNGIEGSPVFKFQYTKPEKVMPVVSNGGTNDSISVTWDSPKGIVEEYVVTLNTERKNISVKRLNSTTRSCLFPNLKGGTTYTVTVVTVSGPFEEESRPVSNATYPNAPGAITIGDKTTSSISLEFGEAPEFDSATSYYMVKYQAASTYYSTKTSMSVIVLRNLTSGSSYNISMVTVGPEGFMSASNEAVLVTTRPMNVQSLQVKSVSLEKAVLEWSAPSDFKNGYRYRVTTSSTNPVINATTSNDSYQVISLLPGTEYNFSVTTLTLDGTESLHAVVSVCTDAAPVTDITCQGPNLTGASILLKWSNPRGSNTGFEINVMGKAKDTVPTCDPNCMHNLTSLFYNTAYNVSILSRGCGNSGSVVQILCKTGITVPSIPDTNKHVQIYDVEYDKFTLDLDPGLFNDTEGPIVNYGILITSSVNSITGENSVALKKYLNNTYDIWNSGLDTTYLATIKKSVETNQNSKNSIVIGDNTKWGRYTNGPLKARESYSFAVVMFTRLEEKDGFVDISSSYVSISPFYETEISLPENPVVVASISIAAVFMFLLISVVIMSAIFFKRRTRSHPSEIPILSLRTKVSVPIKVEYFVEYFRKQQANSNCGFAEEFENLKPVGVDQAKTSALALENKGKNRYNNVLPYDTSRVKLSIQGSPYNDYINANYIPGYNSRQEFIAAQGPLASTVNEFWRMIWEKNVHTLVMLTRCNEQGRVKCEEYWPSGTKHFDNLTVTSTSEIALDDWTIRDFNVKNVKTAEKRLLRHFHFTAWPDHGVPETTELLISFRHLVREHMDEFSRHSPTVVHCSAGVGRTGTFIAIDRLIFQIERENVVDVYGIVHDLRMHRLLMVQTEDQYVFLNQCALDIIRSRTGTNVDLIYENTPAISIYENFEAMQKSKNGYHRA